MIDKLLQEIEEAISTREQMKAQAVAQANTCMAARENALAQANMHIGYLSALEDIKEKLIEEQSAPSKLLDFFSKKKA